MKIKPLEKTHQAAAAKIFIQNLQKQRQAVPILPEAMPVDQIMDMLNERSESGSVLAALEEDHLVGYLGWFLVEDFRGAGRKAAYCPVWAHAADDAAASPIYQQLYRAAAAQWAQACCQVHALTFLPYQPEIQRMWFWNGFGLCVVDAVRPVIPLHASPPSTPFTIRKAHPKDIPTIMMLDAEHLRHYTQPPVFMAPHAPKTVGEYQSILENEPNSIWLAFSGQHAAGLMQFEESSTGATDIIQSPTTIAITGAFVQPAFRAQGASSALLNAALRAYQAQGFERCAVDFESFNPEAARFWPKYFAPVCYSVMRRPEMDEYCA